MQPLPQRTGSRRRRRLADFTLAFGLVFPSLLAAQGDPESRRVPVAPITTAAFDYSYSYFQGDIDSWHLASVSLGQRRPAGTFIGRINLANRYASTGAQPEIDAYPTLGKKAYGYLNAGYSSSTIFPEWRFGAEYFRNLAHAYEASLGLRQLRFAGAPVTLLTGSVGRYAGDYWFSLRPFVRQQSKGLSASASLTARRYSADADNFIGGRLGLGTSPSENVILSQLARTSSVNAGIHGSRATSGRTIGTWSLSFERERFTLDGSRNRWEIAGGVKYRF